MRARNYPGVDPEDYAQRIILKWLENGQRGQTLNQAIVDRIREDLGRFGERNIWEERSDIWLMKNKKHRVAEPEKHFGHLDLEQFDMVDKILPEPQSLERALILLHYGLGITQLELAKVFNIDTATCCLQIQKGVKRISRAMKRDKR